MDLEDFVAETLTQISKGVIKAQERTGSLGTVVNPPIPDSRFRPPTLCMGQSENGDHVYMVDFDVALVVNESSGANAGGGIKVASLFSLNAGGRTDSVTQSTSRVKFIVPVALPVDSDAKAAMKQRIEKGEGPAGSRN